MGKTAFIFPGQGAQYNGMARDFVDNHPKSRFAFEEANDRLGFDLKKIVMDGTPEELQQTMVTQPAILTASYSIMTAVEDSGIDCDYTAGLSLGEYNSLIKAKAMRFGDAVSVVRQRGIFMQDAVPSGVGGMAAVMGMEYEILKECLKEAQCEGVVEMANFNSPEQMVISGDLKAVKFAVDIVGRKGAKKAVMLPVSAPFHSSLLKPAAERLQAVLMDTPVYPLEKYVVTNADAKVLEKEDEIVPSLVKQVNNSVLWVPSIEFMMDNDVDTFIEIGPGKALSGFVKRIAKRKGKDVRTYNVENIETLDRLKKDISSGGDNES